jgi:hypothetical protein
MEIDPASEIFVFSYYLEFCTMDKAQKQSDSESYAPLPEPFRI